jgi:hypothetical protein
LSSRLEVLLPDQMESPLEMLRRKPATRRRVRLSRKDSEGSKPWQWGKDEGR